MIDIIFLGTTCMVPTKERNQQGIFIRYRDEGILIDCGEGIQRQFKIAGIKLTKITKILISHWHGDHVLGLPGVMQSLGSSGYTETLEIYGPKGTEKRIKKMMDTFIFDNKLKIKIIDINKNKFFNARQFFLEARKLEHGIPTLGFNFVEKDKRKIKMSYLKELGIPEGPHISRLQEGEDIEYKGKKVKCKDSTYIVKGKKIAVVADTVLCDSCYILAKDADLLICESSFTSEHEDKAREYKHMTAKQAALIASQSNVKKLVLTHFSPRYKEIDEVKKDANEVFREVVCAYDFLKIKV